MNTIKTAISLPLPLFREVEKLAQASHTPRSRIFSLAVEEYLRRHREKDLLQRLNDAHAAPPAEDETAWLTGAKTLYGRALRDTW